MAKPPWIGLVLLLLAACRTPPVTSTDDGGGGGGGPTPDLATPSADVQCGNATCTAPTSVCCRSQPFGAGSCIPPGGACQARSYACDDAADCGGGSICCILQTGSSCLAGADCAMMQGRQACLNKSDCPNGEACCGVGPTPSFYCSASVCPISRRQYKQDIAYLDEEAKARLYDELLRYRLATYRYREQRTAEKTRLGFIIDDVEPSPSIDPSGYQVDLYGYTSMAVAALQVQARQIEALEKEVKALRREVARAKR